MPSTVCIRSAILSMGSPKNFAPPCCSICNRPRWMAPMEAGETLPYCVRSCAALSPTNCSKARKSFRSSNSSRLSSATLKASASTPSWVSFRLSSRAINNGPMSETVARMGWPCSPQTSHNVTGQPCQVGSVRWSWSSRAFNRSDSTPGLAIPVRSPLMSAMNTGTPMREKLSARTCKLTVLPVPVAPVMHPWRLAKAGSRARSSSPDRAMISGSAI